MAIKLKVNREENKYEIENPEETANGEKVEIDDGTKKKPFPWGILCLVFAILSMFIMGFYALAPFVTLLIYLTALIFAGFYWLVVVAIPVVCTLFIILASDKYRAFASTAMNWAEPLFKGDRMEITTFLQNSFIYVFITTLVIMAVGLIYSILAKVFDKKKDTDKTARLIVMIIVTVLFTVGAVISGRMYL